MTGEAQPITTGFATVIHWSIFRPGLGVHGRFIIVVAGVATVCEDGCAKGHNEGDEQYGPPAACILVRA